MSTSLDDFSAEGLVTKHRVHGLRQVSKILLPEHVFHLAQQ